ncbi:MAG: DNA ligase (NAD(+)) LigA [Pelagibacteraceae bacterium]|nr:DNA ligase (NAD(+)) LigA [Pelagibacteraceae bacterium]
MDIKKMKIKDKKEKNVKKIKEEYLKLKNEINSHNKLYYDQNNPKISDSEYDLLWNELKSLEEKFPFLKTKKSPTIQVGYKANQGFSKVKHSSPMLSLENALNIEDVKKYIEKISRYLNLKNEFIELVAEPKIDGLSISLKYKNGKFISGATRGDGQIGEDVTSSLMTIKNIPKEVINLKNIDVFEIRGEIYMDKKDFLFLNKNRKLNGESLFANPRNAAAGSLRQLDNEVVKKRNLKFFAYTYGEISKEIAFKSQKEFLDIIRHYGFPTNEDFKICKNFNDIEIFYNEIEKKRDKLKYDIDGIVYKINYIDVQKRLGLVGRAPRWAIARKFPAEKAETQINDIKIQVGRTGILTPVAELNPVLIGGVRVSRVSLHNQDEIDRKDIRIGDTIKLQRAGDVIPQVISVDLSKRLKNSKKFIIPDKCPCCKSKTHRKENEVAVKCTGGLSICEDQQLGSLEYFVSRNAFNIEGLGGKNLKKFWMEGFIKYPFDIFYLDKFKEKIISKEGFGEKSYLNLIKSINEKKIISLEKFIYSLGIPQIGRRTSNLLSKHFKNFHKWFISIENLSNGNVKVYNDYINIDGIGPDVVDDIKNFFNNEKIKIVKKLSQSLKKIEDYKFLIKSNSKLSEKIIVFTGTLEKMSRSEAKSKAEELGAKVTNSVSNKTDYVIAGKDSGSKEKKAKDLKIKVLNENEWMKFLS